LRRLLRLLGDAGHARVNSISYSIALPATSAWLCKNPLACSAHAANNHIRSALPMQTMAEISVEKKRQLKLAPPPDITGRVNDCRNALYEDAYFEYSSDRAFYSSVVGTKLT